jgi:hypothetical protein
VATAIEVEPMNELYQDDILLWSERQSELLRRLAGGERVNDQVDWEAVIEDVGRRGTRANCSRSRRCCGRLSPIC